MSLQKIINISNKLSFNRRRVVGIQYARNEIPRVSETPTMNPWKLQVSVSSSLKYNEARAILEDLDRMDKTIPEVITFSNNPNLSWLLAYQGGLTTIQRGNIIIQSFIGNQLVLNVSTVNVSAGTYILKKGDFIQIQGQPYPFTSTSDVTRGVGSTVTVTTHRPNIITDSVMGYGLNWGNDVQFQMFCPNMPTYTLSPGGYHRVGNAVVNNALVSFDGDFNLYEMVGNA